jgi:hypothetical protein
MMKISLLTCGFLSRFDKLSTIETLSELKDTRRQRHRSIGRALFIVGFAFISAFQLPYTAQAWKHHEMNYKLHAHNILKDFDQFDCLVRLYEKESRWDPLAKNGSHHGIPQGRSRWLAGVDGFRQVEWGIRYIEHRYGTPCKALKFFKKNNYH